MPNRSCPSCHRRLPYAARRCLRCDWSYPESESREGVAGSSRALVVGIALAGMLGGGLGYRNADSIASWYADFAARRLPSSLSSWAPTDTDAGAFFFCARQVSRRMDGDLSVETFPSLDQTRSVTLSEGRYRIASFVEEAREDGERVRHQFVCTVHFERGRWVLENLDMVRNLAETDRSADAEAARVLGLRNE